MGVRKSQRFCTTRCCLLFNRGGGRDALARHPEFFRWDCAAATRTLNSSGYVRLIWSSTADGPGGMELEHRMVLAQKLNRPLRPGETAHHVNGNKLDNRPENLELWLGPVRNGQRAREVTCPHCGKGYRVEDAGAA